LPEQLDFLLHFHIQQAQNDGLSNMKAFAVCRGTVLIRASAHGLAFIQVPW
jgi:hypothetical protein